MPRNETVVPMLPPSEDRGARRGRGRGYRKSATLAGHLPPGDLLPSSLTARVATTADAGLPGPRVTVRTPDPRDTFPAPRRALKTYLISKNRLIQHNENPFGTQLDNNKIET